MTDQQARRAMVAVAADWLEGKLVTEDFVRRYWQTRRELLDSNWNAFTGPFGQIMSSMDTAVDSYSADADRGAHQIDERRLREESEAVMTHLRRSGLDLFQ
jgi:hypothetical protein